MPPTLPTCEKSEKKVKNSGAIGFPELTTYSIAGLCCIR